MSLVPSRDCAINEIRAQYLATVESDQTRRIIRPFTLTDDGDATQLDIQQLSKDYNSKKFSILFAHLESPPLPVNVLEDGQLVRKLNLVKSSDVIDETDEEDTTNIPTSPALPLPDISNTVDKGESKNSLATVRTAEPDVSTIAGHQRLGSHGTIKKHKSTISYKPPFTKLFRNTSTSTAGNSRKSSLSKSKTDTDGYDDDDDDDDDDDSNDDDSTDEIDESDGVSQGDNEAETLGKGVNNTDGSDDSGILVEQNYSDMNNPSQRDKYNHGEIYSDNSVSSVDDELLLDSDFTDDGESGLLDGDYSTSSLPIPKPQSSQSLAPNAKTVASGKLKAQRSISLSMKISNSAIPSLDQPLRHIKSNSNLLESSQSQDDALLFPKSEIEPHGLIKSNLTQMINSKLKVNNRDPLEYFLFVSGENISNKLEILKLKVYLPNDKILTLTVRKSVTVFETIGFILYKMSKLHPELLKVAELKNANKWCIKLVDDDGEPYEGSFGLLDRTKEISSYGEDEVALVQVNDTEFQENNIKTPLPVLDEASSTTPSPSKKKLRQSDYYKTIIPKVDNDIKDAAILPVNIYEYPFKGGSGYIKFEFQVTAKMNEILVKVCRTKKLDPNDYVLKVVGEDLILDLNDSISGLDGSHNLELLTKRKARELNLKKKKVIESSTLATINSALTPHSLAQNSLAIGKESNQSQMQPQSQAKQQNSVQRRHSFSSRPIASSFTKHGLSSSFKTKNSSKHSLSNPSSAVPNMAATEYQRYTVWRRLPVSFINRHERTFAIDGEYVYVIPKDDKLWYENNFKTTTFHVSQIISCKVSKRIPQNFKIVVMKANGPKRYDFEAMNVEESAEIIKKLQALMNAYKINTGSHT